MRHSFWERPPWVLRYFTAPSPGRTNKIQEFYEYFILHISRAGRGKEALLVITELIINQSLTVGNFTVQQNAHPQVTLCCLGSGLSRVKASCGQEGHKILADGRRHTLAAYYVAYASNQFRDTRSGARCKTHQLVPVLSNREGQRENPTPLSA